jgi:hypothetical protein
MKRAKKNNFFLKKPYITYFTRRFVSTFASTLHVEAKNYCIKKTVLINFYIPFFMLISTLFDVGMIP